MKRNRRPVPQRGRQPRHRVNLGSVSDIDLDHASPDGDGTSGAARRCAAWTTSLASLYRGGAGPHGGRYGAFLRHESRARSENLRGSLQIQKLALGVIRADEY